MSINEVDEMLLGFGPLDILLLSELMIDVDLFCGSLSAERWRCKVDEWSELLMKLKSVRFPSWIRGQKGFSKASEIFESWDRPRYKATSKDDAARKLDTRQCSGRSCCGEERMDPLPVDLERRWKVGDLDEIQEALAG